jgi:large subunit ribosomal protein L3
VPSGTFFVLNMLNTVFAKKISMTGKYTPEGKRVGSTVLKVPTMIVKDLRTKEKHGYTAVRFKIQDPKFKKEIIREVRTEEALEPGTEVKFEEMLKPGDVVTVSGTSKGKGFAGVVKRWHFKGGPRTHGQSDRERSPGSSGSTTTPGRVFKGKRRAGHMGNETATVVGLRVMEVNPGTRTLVLGGGVPGQVRGFGLITVSK